MTSLRQPMIEDMQIRNLAVHTQNMYVIQVSMFARHFSQSPELLGPEEIRTHQVYLTTEKKLATSSILTAISALRFLYKVALKRDWTFAAIIPAPKKPQKLPIVLSPEEVIQFLNCVTGVKHRVILTTCKKLRTTNIIQRCFRGGRTAHPTHGVLCERQKRGSHHLLHLPTLQLGMEKPHPPGFYTSSLTSPADLPFGAPRRR